MRLPSSVTYTRLRNPPTINAAGGANIANPEFIPVTESTRTSYNKVNAYV